MVFFNSYAQSIHYYSDTDTYRFLPKSPETRRKSAAKVLLFFDIRKLLYAFFEKNVYLPFLCLLRRVGQAVALYSLCPKEHGFVCYSCGDNRLLGAVLDFEFLAQLVGCHRIVAGKDGSTPFSDGVGQVLEHTAREGGDHLPHASREVGKQVVGSIEMGVRGKFGKAEVLAHKAESGGFENRGIRLIEVARGIRRMPIGYLCVLLLFGCERQRLPMVLRVVGGGIGPPPTPPTKGER